MPNWAFPNWPPYTLNGWMIMPRFPSRWYHPVHGSRLIANASQFMDLERGWFPDPGMADMARTELEAGLVITHDVNLALVELTEGDANGDPDKVNRRSASWQQVLDEGWDWASPLGASGSSGGGTGGTGTTGPTGTAGPVGVPSGAEGPSGP